MDDNWGYRESRKLPFLYPFCSENEIDVVMLYFQWSHIVWLGSQNYPYGRKHGTPEIARETCQIYPDLVPPLGEILWLDVPVPVPHEVFIGIRCVPRNSETALVNKSIYIYTWANYDISLTWIKAIWGWFPLLTMIPVRSQWGRYNLPRYIYPRMYT